MYRVSLKPQLLWFFLLNMEYLDNLELKFNTILISGSRGQGNWFLQGKSQAVKRLAERLQVSIFDISITNIIRDNPSDWPKSIFKEFADLKSNSIVHIHDILALFPPKTLRHDIYGAFMLGISNAYNKGLEVVVIAEIVDYLSLHQQVRQIFRVFKL